MKRIIVTLALSVAPGLVLTLLLSGAGAGAGAAAVAGAAADAGAAAVAVPAAAQTSVRGDGDVNDFTFSSFDATYALDTDDDGHSRLTVVETLVAEFPQTDQNRGIRRELVDSYDGHPTDLEVRSVENENGDPREYESESDGDFEVLTIADDDFVQGEQTYVITYEQHNVTRYFADTDSDEFYWDTNGTGWAQPFDRVTATVSIAPELAARLTGRADAASGAEGADEPAEVTGTDTGTDTSYTFTATELGPGENLSFAIGFQKGTFVARDSSFGAAPWPLLSLIGAIIALLAAGGAVVVRRTRLRDAPSRGIIVPEYLPPKNTSVLLSSVISHTTTKATTAEILALAVAGNLRIVEVTDARKPSFRLDFVSDSGTDDDERAFLHALFGAELTPGETRSLKKSDAKAVSRITKLRSKVAADSIADGYRRALPVAPIALVVGAGVLGALASVIFAAVSLSEDYGGAVPAAFLAVGILALTGIFVLVVRRPLEAKGVELRDYLLGLKQYIALAEADRIRYLQSPEGAERRPFDTDDAAQVVRLNERLLPYAVLFGHEKRWVRELGRHYEELGTQPTWYYGSGPFNAALFASSIGSVATSVSSSYSSTSGGSGGGAVSGGGGGGGGGGGV